MKELILPCPKEELEGLRMGDMLLVSGVIYTARDAAHQRMMADLDRGQKPFPLKDSAIYYVGPTPAKPGSVIGSAGPTTSGRMDKYTPRLLDLGLSVMIGKGKRSPAVIESMKKNKAVYLGAIGGAGALIAQKIHNCSVLAYEDLGPEAIYKLEICKLPLVVVIDSMGNDLSVEGPKQYCII